LTNIVGKNEIVPEYTPPLNLIENNETLTRRIKNALMLAKMFINRFILFVLSVDNYSLVGRHFSHAQPLQASLDENIETYENIERT